ncbi:MAG: CRISPR-associated protein Cas4 [Thermotogae bacterium]|nr:CRISPR-associated protein Cas4 [Thermotogota bacterium]
MVANGTLVWYYFICKRQVWFMGRGIEPYHDNPLLAEGRTISQIVFSRITEGREVLIDNRIKIDILKGNVVMEVKKSSRYLEASRMQLLFYLYYLKRFKGVDASGILVFPDERKRKRIKLTEEDVRRLEEVISDIEDIVSRDSPPDPVKTRYCRKCAYKEMCWA